MTQDPDQDSGDRLVRQRREELSQALAVVSALLGLGLIGVSLAKLLFGATSSVGVFSLVQAVQGILGAVLVWVVHTGAAKRFFLTAFSRPANQLRVFLLPLLVWPLFLTYRFAIEQRGDVKVYLRRITEGSLVEWMSFILLMFSAWLLWQAASDWGVFKDRLAGRGLAALLFIAAMEEMS